LCCNVIDEEQAGNDVLVVRCLETSRDDGRGPRDYLSQQPRSQLGLKNASQRSDVSGEEDVVHEEVHRVDRVPVEILGQGRSERTRARKLHLSLNLDYRVDQVFKVHIGSGGKEMEDIGDTDEFVDTFVIMERLFGRSLQHLWVCDESEMV